MRAAGITFLMKVASCDFIYPEKYIYFVRAEGLSQLHKKIIYMTFSKDRVNKLEVYFFC
jgi:hypothetical protein